MKKFIFIALILLLTLSFMVSCEKKDETTANVAVLNGTTGFGMAQLMEQNANNASENNYTFTVHTKPADIQKALINGDVDIAALSTSAASIVYNQSNGAVKVIALNTLGVLYVVENGNTVNSIEDLANKKIYCPADPSAIVKALLYKNNIVAEIDTTYAYPADLNKAVTAGALKDAENVIAVLPEPVLTTALNANSNLSVRLDLTSEWNKVDENSLVQGCVVVRTEFLNEHKSLVDKFLDEYEASINFLKNDVNTAASYVVKHGIFANENVAKIAIPKCNVTYIDGNEMKETLEAYLSSIYAVVPANIGDKVPDSGFYYVG